MIKLEKICTVQIHTHNIISSSVQLLYLNVFYDPRHKTSHYSPHFSLQRFAQLTTIYIAISSTQRNIRCVRLIAFL